MQSVLKFHPPAREEAPHVSPGMDRAAPRRSPPLGMIALGGAILLAVSLGALGYVKYGMTRTARVSADQLTTATVHRGVFKDYVSTTGSVAPRVTVFLDSVDGGQVDQVLVEQGATVKAGQPLVRLKNRRLELDVATNEAQFTQQENSLAALQLSYGQSNFQHQQAVDEADDQINKLTADIARYRPLADKGYYAKASLEDLERQLAFQQRERSARQGAQHADRDGAEKQVAALKASTERQKQALALIRDGLANLTVTAPIDGQLTSLDAQLGQALAAGQKIGQIDRIDSFKVVVLADEFYLGRIQPGQAATVSLDGRPVAMRVAKVYPDVKERRFQVDLDFIGPPPASVRAGQSLEARVELGAQQGSLLVDSGAFYDDGGGQFVFVVTKDGASATRRTVRLGRRTTDAVEVLSGLAPGERIVTSSYQPYRDAQRLDITGHRSSEGKP